MYGRIFEGMFTGSMRGVGAVRFTVWTYVIANMREDKTVGVQVELRPDLLAFYIGEKQADIEEAIEFLCRPDPDSTCQDEDGRRLVPVGKFVYRVVSGPHYVAIRNQQDLREYQRLAKRRQRAAKKGQPLPGERTGEQPHEWRMGPGGDLEGPPVETATSSQATSGRSTGVAPRGVSESAKEVASNPERIQSAESADTHVVHRTLAEHQALRRAPAPSTDHRVPAKAHPSAPEPVPATSAETPVSQGVQTIPRSSGPPISSPSRNPGPARSVAQVLPGALRRLPRPAANALSGGWREEIVSVANPKATAARPSNAQPPKTVPQPPEEEEPPTE